MDSLLSYIVWDPARTIFTIPGLDRPVVWYGVLFALGFFISQQILFRMFRAEGKPEKDVEILTVYMIIATVIGARLGHVFFYEPAKYLANPIDIIKIWEGGLASHGATIAILIALYMYSRKKADQSYFWVLDRLVIVVAITGALIRFGNFTNSEIIGTPSHSNYGVVFARSVETQLESDSRGVIENAEASKSNHEVSEGYVPIKMTLTFAKKNYEEEKLKGYIENNLASLLVNYSDWHEPHIYFGENETLQYDLSKNKGVYEANLFLSGVSRHPGQLYESLGCIVIFILLFTLWYKKRDQLQEGTIFAIFLIILFGLRFIYEFFKENQAAFEEEIPLNMGQWLSLPLIAAGIIILISLQLKKNKSQGTGS